MTTPMLYASAPLDRAAHFRRDADALRGLFASPAMRMVAFWRGLSLVSEAPAARWLTLDEAAPVMDGTPDPVFLGLRDGAPVFALDLSGLDGGEAGPELGLGGRFVQLRTVAALLPLDDASVLGYARAILAWHGRCRFCGDCGAPTRVAEGGHCRLCTSETCGAQHYPRTDPAVIMLVEDGDRVLLHRQPSWPKGQWSVLAGFVEAGETLEQAVAREVLEETGIVATDITYAGSQPWPFPSSLMLAFTARAAGGTLRPDPHELEDARWYGRAEIKANFDDAHRGKDTGLYLPTQGSVARRMMEAWLAGE